MSEEKDGSTYKVPLTTIREIKPHPNADKLEIAIVYGFEVVVQKDRYKTGDPVIYIPIDSILSSRVESILFPADSKIKLNRSRVRQIKIRGYYSQGMVVDPKDLANDKINLFKYDAYLLEEDLSEELGITKYNPPEALYQQNKGSVKKRDKRFENPFFHKYGGIDNAKWYPDLFEENEVVSITEKIHGSNIRCGLVPTVANTPFKKLLKTLNLLPSHEWVYGSNQVQLQERASWWRFWNRYKGFYGSDVYGAVLKKYRVKDKLKPGEVVYGEIYGDGIQGGYNYGCKPGEHKLVLFDLMIQTGTSSDYVSPDDFFKFCEERGFPRVPELYRGPFGKELAKNLTLGDSVLEPSQKVREGIVIKPVVETTCHMGRKMLKMLSEVYLSKEQSDFH